MQMLDAWIIQKIKESEKKKPDALQIPLFEDPPCEVDKDDVQSDQNRGVYKINITDEE